MPMKNLERNISMYKDLVNGQTGKQISSNYNVSPSRIFHLCRWLHRMISHYVDIPFQWDIEKIRSNNEFWCNASDRYLDHKKQL